MKKLIVVISILLLLQQASADNVKTINITYDIEDFTLAYDSSGSLNISSQKKVIYFDENPSEPALPLISANILLPNGYTYSDIAITKVETLVLGNVMLPANPLPVITSDSFSMPTTSVTAYENKTYPSTCVTYVGTNVIDGCAISHFLISPFKYDAENKDLYFIENITLNIILKPIEQANSYHKNKNMRSAVKRLVINSEELDSISANDIPTDSCNIDYAVITSAELASSFSQLKEWKITKGIRTEIYTTDEIAKNYKGESLQMAIKSFLYDLYASRGLKYAMLGGDDTIVPARGCYGLVSKNEDKTIPTDLYYACFDGDFSWDGNGNGIYGESTDGINMYPSIFVTRIPVRTTKDVASFTTKLLTYEKEPTKNGWNNEMLTAGTKLWNYYSQKSDAELKGDNLYNNIIAEKWNGKRIKFYDTYTDFSEEKDYDLNTVNLQTQLSHGYAFVEMITHGSPIAWGLEAGDLYSKTDALDLTNNNSTIITTNACLTNAFDNADEPCLSEAFIRNGNNGVIAYLGCSRYGWGSYGGSLGASMQYEAQFYNNVFAKTGNIRFGVATAEAKMAHLNMCNSYGSMRWVQFGLNPIGDPEMPIFTTTPIRFSSAKIKYDVNNIYIDTGVGGCNICVMSINDKGKSFYDVREDTQKETFTNIQTDVSICITKQNYIPKIDTLKYVLIQNETVGNDANYDANIIKMGTSVTSSKKNGAVIIEGKDINLKANIIYIEPEDTITEDTEITLSNK